MTKKSNKLALLGLEIENKILSAARMTAKKDSKYFIKIIVHEMQTPTYAMGKN